MNIVKKFTGLIFFLFSVYVPIRAQDYDVLDFGAKNDGVSLNTNIIQHAIDYISENGGGRLVFNSGVFISGSIYLKTGVTLHLEPEAELRGSDNPFDYIKDDHIGWTSLVFGLDQKRIGITGEGTINTNGYVVAIRMIDYIYNGLVVDPLSYDRPDATNRPVNIYIRECEDVQLTDHHQKNPGSWNLIIDQCKNVLIDRITIDAKAYWNNDGIDIVDSEDVIIKNSYVDASDDAICFKSHDPNKIGRNVLVENCTVRSSASGLKFGTVNRGGFQDITVKNLKVFDTHRSAVTIQAVDGGIAENIIIDGVDATNVGNAIYLRIGDRWGEDVTPKLENITIRNLKAEITASKADAGYRYEGPVEDLPRNTSPSGIVGLPAWRIKNVRLENVEIIYPGGGNPYYASHGVSEEELRAIPEMPYRYPEFSQFKELPAWGFYIRHADNVVMNNVRLRLEKEDYRPVMVLDDSQGFDFKSIKVNDAIIKKDSDIILNNSEGELK